VRLLWLLAAGAAYACTLAPPQPPPRPAGVPVEAVWAGGVDGGDWLLCVPEVAAPKGSFSCRVFSDQTGLLTTQGKHVFAECEANGACTPQAEVPSTLRYEFFDGVTVHLADELALVPDGEIDHPFGDGHGKRAYYRLGQETGPEVQY
jgi:hypothetical protein